MPRDAQEVEHVIRNGSAPRDHHPYLLRKDFNSLKDLVEANFLRNLREDQPRREALEALSRACPKGDGCSCPAVGQPSCLHRPDRRAPFASFHPLFGSLSAF